MLPWDYGNREAFSYLGHLPHDGGNLMILVLAAFLILCCVALAVGSEFGRRRRRREEAEGESPAEPALGRHLDRWLVVAVMVLVPVVWVVAYLVGGFSSILKEIYSPKGYLPLHKTDLPGTAVPVPLHQFGLGVLMFLGPIVFAYDLYFVSSWLYRRFHRPADSGI